MAIIDACGEGSCSVVPESG